MVVGGQESAQHPRGIVDNVDHPADAQVSWIGSATMPGFHTNHTEDVQTAQWLRNLDIGTDPVRSIDIGKSVANYKEESLGVETIALRESCLLCGPKAFSRMRSGERVAAYKAIQPMRLEHPRHRSPCDCRE